MDGALLLITSKYYVVYSLNCGLKTSFIWCTFRMMNPYLPNTRPITIVGETNLINNRGRVYECLRCGPAEAYQGERAKVLLHIFRKHVALDSVPFYCSICKFVTTSQTELVKHVQPAVYPTHKATVDAMVCNGEQVNERDSLLQNLKHYVPTEHDLKRLSKEESQEIFSARRKPDRRVVISTGLDRTDVQSDATDQILDKMLGGAELTPCSLNNGAVIGRATSAAPIRDDQSVVDILPQLLNQRYSPFSRPSPAVPQHTTASNPSAIPQQAVSQLSAVPQQTTASNPSAIPQQAVSQPSAVPQQTTASQPSAVLQQTTASQPSAIPQQAASEPSAVSKQPTNDQRPPNSPSPSSSASSFSSSSSTSVLKAEIVFLRNEVRTMGAALGQLVTEMKELRQELQRDREQKTTGDKQTQRHDKENKRPEAKQDDRRRDRRERGDDRPFKSHNHPYDRPYNRRR